MFAFQNITVCKIRFLGLEVRSEFDDFDTLTGFLDLTWS